MKTVIIGAGGHASVVIDAAQAAGAPELVGLIDVDPAKKGTEVLGVPVIGNDDDLTRLQRQGIEGFIIGLGHSRSLSVRAKLFQMAVAGGLVPVTIVHPRASVASSARLGRGVVVLAGAVVNVEAFIDDNTILNSGSIVEHHCRVGRHCHVAPGAVLCGNVVLDSEVLVGANATVREGVRIGSCARLGMGGVVVRDVPPGSLVVGNPAHTLSGRNE